MKMSEIESIENFTYSVKRTCLYHIDYKGKAKTKVLEYNPSEFVGHTLEIARSDADAEFEQLVEEFKSGTYIKYPHWKYRIVPGSPIIPDESITPAIQLDLELEVYVKLREGAKITLHLDKFDPCSILKNISDRKLRQGKSFEKKVSNYFKI